MARPRPASRKSALRVGGLGIALALTAALVPGQVASARPDGQDNRGDGGGGSAACDRRANNSYQKLLECMTLEGVREHQRAFQRIANRSTDPVYPGTRAAGTDGYADSVDYVAGLLEEAGYEVSGR